MCIFVCLFACLLSKEQWISFGLKHPFCFMFVAQIFVPITAVSLCLFVVCFVLFCFSKELFKN
jgi:hypothetical protein